MLVRAACLLLALVAACGDEDPPAGESCQIEGTLNPSTIPAIDLLFVIDESATMAPHQASLAVQMRRFATLLESIEGGLPSLHVAVVSADSSGGGAFVGGECAEPGAAFLSNERAAWWTCGEDRASRCGVPNHTDALADVMACMGTLGADGAGTHQPLEAMRLALDAGNPDRADFLREDALLAVYFIGATDDASIDAVARYADALRDAKAEVADIIVGVVGDGPGPRSSAFLSEFPGRNSSVAIGADDWAEVMTTLAELFRRTLGVACLHESVALPLDCVAAEDRALQEPIAPCDMLTDTRPDPNTPLPCWWVDDTGATECGLQPIVERADFDLHFPTLLCAAACML